MASGRNTLLIVPIPSATQTAGGSGASVATGNRSHLELTLSVTDLVGPGASLSAMVETSSDELAWRPLAVFSPTTATGAQTLVLSGARGFVRVSWTLAGTSATFAVTGNAQISYADVEDLETLGLARAFQNVGIEPRAKALLAASSELDSYHVATDYELPLVSWGTSLRRRTCALASWNLLTTKGFNPEVGSDVLVRTVRDDAIADAKRGYDPEIVDSTTEVEEGQAVIVSSPKRRW